MSPDPNAAVSSESLIVRSLGRRANWDERVVTGVAVSMAVLVVAAIAVLMGMT